ncbi:hypothetical protein ACOMHN_045250 [Nucella lapillus]
MADNVDHDTATLDGRGTFHGMGIIASVTPGVKAARRVPRRDVSLKDIKAIGKIKIPFFRSSSAKVWDIQAVQSVLGEDVCKHILFAHAIGGCDTVSGLFSIGKSIPFKKDMKNQILTTNCWLNQIWTDVGLQWDPEKYGGIRVVRLPYDEVWRPDILLYNK